MTDVRAHELVLKQLPPPLRKMLSALQGEVAKMNPAFAPPCTPDDPEATFAAYLFLATRGRSADRE